MSPEINLNDIISYLDRQPGVAAAYLFGSYARGRATNASDVAVLKALGE
ncbi:MAG TPA: hypothetical protein DCM26_01760 [Desulfotomaculum sp.]|jgi:predicted nucleotidyltransferase|nr:hypothetical protein [Desulfotomaculum sp.]